MMLVKASLLGWDNMVVAAKVVLTVLKAVEAVLLQVRAVLRSIDPESRSLSG